MKSNTPTHAQVWQFPPNHMNKNDKALDEFYKRRLVLPAIAAVHDFFFFHKSLIWQQRKTSERMKTKDWRAPQSMFIWQACCWHKCTWKNVFFSYVKLLWNAFYRIWHSVLVLKYSLKCLWVLTSKVAYLNVPSFGGCLFSLALQFCSFSSCDPFIPSSLSLPLSYSISSKHSACLCIHAIFLFRLLFCVSYGNWFVVVAAKHIWNAWIMNI